MPSQLQVVKLGGSVITNKARPFSIRQGVISSIARVLARQRHYILVHGAGSYGHVPVRRYGLTGSMKSHGKLIGYAKTKASLLKLEQQLTSILAESGVPVAPVLASSCLISDRGRILRHNYEPVDKMLKLGLVPCIGGDIVQDTSLGASVVSGDQMAASLALAFHARTIIFGTDVDGLYTSDPKLSSRARLVTRVRAEELQEWVERAGRAITPDVTGGMRGKLREVLPAVRAGVRVVVLNLNKPDRLERAMAGKKTTGTLIC